MAGHAAYLDIKEAEEKYDSGYCEVHGGLKICTLEGPE
jgi:hypothetical protein